MKEGSIGFAETLSLISILIFNKVFFTSPSIIIKSLGTAAWYGTLVSCLTSILFLLVLYALMKRFPGMDLVQVFEQVAGKFLGKLLAMAYCIYFVYYAGSNLREFVEMIKAYNLPYTPPSFILGTFIIVTALLSYLGLEALARVSHISIFPVLGGLFIILLLCFPYYHVDYLKPVWGYGVQKTLITGFFRSSAYDEVVVLAFIIRAFKNTGQLKKAGIGSLALSGIVFSSTLLFSLMAFQYAGGSENLSSAFQLSRIIGFGRFFQRIEAIFLLIWVISSILAVSVALYIALSIYCKVFRIGDHRPLIPPFAFLTFLVAILPENLSEVIEVNIRFIRQGSMLLTYGIPVLVLLLSLMLGRKGGKAVEAKS